MKAARVQVEQGKGKWRKKWKHREERRRAKLNPECQNCYKKYNGYD